MSQDASKAAPRALESRDATIDVDDEGRPGVFAVCSGSWGGGPLVAQGFQAPFDLLRAED